MLEAQTGRLGWHEVPIWIPLAWPGWILDSISYVPYICAYLIAYSYTVAYDTGFAGKPVLDYHAGDAYHDAVADAYWLRGQPIDSRELLADIAESVGLERAAFLSALDAPEYHEAVDAEIPWARQ